MVLALVPYLWSVGAELEGYYYPVVTRAEIVQVEYNDRGAIVYLRFNKVRQCGFVGLQWYNNLDRRLGIEFEPESADLPPSRPTGQQYTGPWLIRGLYDINGSRAVVTHNCHPLWETISVLYP